MYVLRFTLLTQDELIFYTNTDTPRETVTVDVGNSVQHLRTDSGQYMPYMPSFHFSKSNPRVDLIVKHSPSDVIAQFDVEACSSYLDMKTGK